MILKRIALTLAFLAGATMAQAATLGTVQTVVGGATYADSGTANVIAGDLSYTGNPFGSASPNPGDLLLSTLTGAPANTFSILSVLSSLTALSGSLLDTDDGPGTITALYQTTGGTYASDFGSLFRVTLINGLFTDTTLGPVTPTFAGGTQLTLEAVEAINVVPLPAAGWFLIVGVGGLAAMRRKQKPA